MTNNKIIFTCQIQIHKYFAWVMMPGRPPQRVFGVCTFFYIWLNKSKSAKKKVFLALAQNATESIAPIPVQSKAETTGNMNLNVWLLPTKNYCIFWPIKNYCIVVGFFTGHFNRSYQQVIEYQSMRCKHGNNFWQIYKNNLHLCL